MATTATDTLQSRNQERLDASASGSSSKYMLTNRHKASVHVVLSNTDCVGTLKIQVSNDATNWVDTALTISVTSGNDVNELLEIDVYAKFFRATYTRTSGGTDQYFELFLHTVTR